MENLCCRIENLRHRMHVTALEKGISHPEVLKISCELDQLLNEFYKLSLAKNVNYEKRSVASLVEEECLPICLPACQYRFDGIARRGGQAVSNA